MKKQFLGTKLGVQSMQSINISHIHWKKISSDRKLTKKLLGKVIPKSVVTKDTKTASCISNKVVALNARLVGRVKMEEKELLREGKILD